jgi:hypothetical protein
LGEALAARLRLKSGKKLGLFGKTAISKHISISLEALILRRRHASCFVKIVLHIETNLQKLDG